VVAVMTPMTLVTLIDNYLYLIRKLPMARHHARHHFTAEVTMLDNAFLRSLGVREEMLPGPPGPQGEEMESDLLQSLPTAGPRGVPAELLDLSEAELEKLLREEHTQDNSYVFCMPDGIHQAAVYPDKVRREYDLEWPAQEFINVVALARDPEIEGMLAYKPGHGSWHAVAPNPSQEVADALLRLDDDDRGITSNKP
jgi:hypothetical protein